jgi:hypothetical protein
MKKVPRMREFFGWRASIMQGLTATQIAEYSGYPVETVRNYTKDERARVKVAQKEAKFQAETQMNLRLAHRQFG